LLEDDSNVDTPVGGILEAYTINESELLKLGDGNAFKMEVANLLIEPWASITWSHAYGHEARNGNGYCNVPDKIWNDLQTKLIQPRKAYIGYEVGGRRYTYGEKIW